MKRPGKNALKPRAVVLAVVGVLLVVGGTAAGYDALRLPQPSQAPVGKVGVAVDIGGQAASGLYMRAVYSTQGCSNPVRVSLLLAPTTRFWQQHPARGEDRRLGARGVSRARLSAARVSVAIDDDGDGGSVRRPTVRQATLEELLMGLGSTPSGTHRPFAPLFTVARVQRTGNMWVASVRLRAWPATHAAIVVSFSADWIAPRTRGTCYLQLPPLLGIRAHDATIAAASAAGQRIQQATVGLGAYGLESSSPIDHASAVVIPTDGVIDPANATPPPQLLYPHQVGWFCARPPRVPDGGAFITGRFELYQQSHAPQPYPAPVSGSEIGPGNDCTATVVIQSGGAIRDGELLITGLLIPLGLGLALHENWLRAAMRRIRQRARGRRGRQSPPALQPVASSRSTHRMRTRVPRAGSGSESR